MKFSVITICYNEKNIKQTCESIANQTYDDIEWIIIDGGSDSETLDIINQYKDNIAVLVSEKDNGVYNAMNKGLKYVTGDYVIFLNGGDSFYNSSVLSDISKIIKKTKYLDFYYGDVNEISADGLSSKIRKHNNLNLKNAKQFYFFNINHQVIFYKKTLLDSVGNYDETYKIYADWDLNIRCFYKRKTKYKYIPIVVSNYLLGGISSTHHSMCDKDNAIIKEKYFKDAFFKKLDAFLYKYLRTPYKIYKKLKNKQCDSL